MNCQDISRIADTGRIGTLTQAERSAAEAHVRSCSRCAAVWSAHSRLLALDTPAMPVEVSRRFNALAGLAVRPPDRQPLRRLTVVGSVVALAAAAGFLIWRLGGPASPATEPAATATAWPLADDAGATGDGVSTATLVLAGPSASAGAAIEPATCTRIVKDAEAFATQELIAAYPALATEQDDAQLQAELAELQRRLAASRDPEVFLTAVLLIPPERRLAEDPAARALLLDLGTRATDSGSSLLAWHALRACVVAEQSCPYEQSVPALLEVDGQNAEAWALVAMRRHQRGDVAGALAAMQGAARAPNATWYWAESSATIERSLSAETAMSLPERFANAFGSAAATLPPLAVSSMCKVESARSRAWAQACLAFGTLRAERGDTMAARGMAYSIREQALTALGDTDRAAEVAAEYALFDAQRIGGGLAPVGGLLTTLAESDPARLRAYIGALQQYGEGVGIRMFLRQQLPPLMERAGLLGREGARECAAQLFEPRTAIGSRAATAAHRIQVADELLISVRNPALSTAVRVRPDGTFMMPLSSALMTGTMTARQLEREIAAAGKTTEELQREIATLFTRRDESPRVFVILVSPRSREELRREFDIALRETAELR